MPLAKFALAGKTGGDEARLSVKHDWCMLSVAAKSGLPAPGKSAWLKTDANTTPTLAIATALNQHFIWREDGDMLALLADMTRRFGKTASFTDQSDAWLCLVLTGHAAPSVLERLCAINTQAHAFPPLSAARTMLAEVDALIIRLPHAQLEYMIFTPRSSAQYVADAFAMTPPFI